MASLEFCEKHNMVAYLKKPAGSEGFHQIVDFLKASSIRYSLTENPTIYTSHIKQFWRTATSRTLEDGQVEITEDKDLPIHVHRFGHNWSIRTRIELIQAATEREFNYLKHKETFKS